MLAKTSLGNEVAGVLPKVELPKSSVPSYTSTDEVWLVSGLYFDGTIGASAQTRNVGSPLSSVDELLEELQQRRPALPAD